MGLVQKAFSDIITFSRSSNATRIGPTGLVEYAPHNLMTYSQAFDNAAWTKSSVTVTSNSATAPDGTVTADRAVFGADGLLFGSGIPSSAGTYTVSVWVKSATGSNQSVRIFGNGALNFSSVLTATNDWQRVTFTYTYSAVTFGFTTAAGVTADVYLWGAQLSVGPYPLDYTPTTSAAVYGPRFDYDPVTLAARGLLVEEQRSNSITYSEQFDNAAWTKQNASISSNAAVAPDGTTTADKLIPDTSDSAAHRAYAIVSTTSGAVTFSCYIKADGYTRAHFTAGANNWVYFNLTAGTVESSLGTGWTAATITAAGNGWYRCTATTSTANNAFYVGCTKDAATNGNSTYSFAGDGTSGILVWGAQLEAGSFATSYIPTLASSVTRSADVASVNTLSPWWNNTEGTFLFDFNQVGTSAIGVIGDDTFNNSLRFNIVNMARGNGTGFANIVTLGTSQNGSNKLAVAMKLNDYAGSFNGAAVSTQTTASMVPTPSVLGIGRDYSTTGYMNGHLRRIAYYPRRLTNAELQALTA